ncbi:MAG: glycosyltransferase family 2 protein [Patescibacteria group bacterium]
MQGIKRKLITYISYLSLVSLFFYFILRVYIYYSQSYGFINSLFGALLLAAETHSVLQSLGFISNIIRLRKTGVNYQRHVKLDLKNLPEVTILVPARNEPLKILEETFICLRSLNYDAKKIMFLDGSDKEYLKENKKLADKYGLEHFVPRVPSKNKAEIVNLALKNIDTKYLSIFDADQNPMPNFLLETVAVAEYSENISFVQTPQLYTNISVGPIAKGAALQQSIFFENICEGKGTSNAMFCCGTNFLMRTKALKEVGGFDENSVTEDFATSVKIHALGYRSVYYNHVRVFGMAPETLSAYFKQQYRWSAGTVGVVRKLSSEVYHGRIKLNLRQVWEYFLSATYYFTGWSFFLLIMCPALYLLFNIPSYFANPIFYLITFVPYYILTATVFYATMKGRNYSMKDVFTGNIMSSLSFPILMQSTLSGILNKKISFQITDKGKSDILPVWKLWPWIIVILFNLLAIIKGFSRLQENYYAIGINMFWCTYHVLLLSNIFKLNKIPKYK